MDEGRTLSAAERRERRLKRILGNSEERMKKILSGPDGDEQRLPPMLEGGEYRSSFLSGYEDDNSSTGYENCTDSKMSSLNSSWCSQYSIFKNVKRMDKPLSLLFGFLVRILMANGILFNVLMPWTVIFFGCHFFTFAKESPKLVNDVAAMLQSGSYSTIERVLWRSNAALEFLHQFTSRLVIMVSGFLIGHSALIIFQILPKDIEIFYT